MRWTPQRLAALISAIAAISGAGGFRVLSAQIPSETGRSEREGLAVSCEVFCSTTTPGSSNARIRWSLSGSALRTRGIQGLSAAKQSLDVTVFYNGFDKDLFVTLPISAQIPERPIAALAPPGPAKLPAYQIQIVEIEQPRTAQTTDSAGDEMSALVARLEPGVNYTWRVVMETSAGRLLSAPVTCQAVICPMDVPLKGKPPIKKP